jgi:hypothetical protein
VNLDTSILEYNCLIITQLRIRAETCPRQLVELFYHVKPLKINAPFDLETYRAQSLMETQIFINRGH